MDTGPDLSHLTAIHRQMRIDTRRLVAAIETAGAEDRSGRLQPLARWVAGFGHELHLHHTIEDSFLFPALADRVPATRDILSGLDADHRVVGSLLELLPAAAARLADSSAGFDTARAETLELAVELRDLLQHHLDVEDDDLFPHYQQHFTAAEDEAIQQQAMRSLPKKGLGFSIPWNVQALAPEVRDELVASAPLPLRLVYRATRRRFVRLVDASFAGVPLPSVA